MPMLKTITRRFVKSEQAATMVEYALMLVLIAAICAAIVGTLGQSVNGAFTSTNAGF
jgi:Flp pilus assembly pilin Flp